MSSGVTSEISLGRESASYGGRNKRRRAAGDRLDEALRGVEFDALALSPHKREVGVRVGVAADLVPLGDDAPDDARDNFPPAGRAGKTPRAPSSP